MTCSIQDKKFITVNTWYYCKKIYNPDDSGVWKAAKIGLLIIPTIGISYGIAWILDYFFSNKQVEVIENKDPNIKETLKERNNVKEEIKPAKKVHTDHASVKEKPEVDTATSKNTAEEKEPQPNTNTKPTSEQPTNTKAVIRSVTPEELKRLKAKNGAAVTVLIEIDPNSNLAKKINNEAAKKIPDELKDCPRIDVLVSKQPAILKKDEIELEPVANPTSVNDQQTEDKKAAQPLTWKKIALVAGFCILVAGSLVIPVIGFAMYRNKNTNNFDDLPCFDDKPCIDLEQCPSRIKDDEICLPRNATIVHNVSSPMPFATEQEEEDKSLFKIKDDEICLPWNATITPAETVRNIDVTTPTNADENWGARFINWFGGFMTDPAKDSLQK
jgi:hypothetical protein